MVSLLTSGASSSLYLNRALNAFNASSIVFWWDLALSSGIGSLKQFSKGCMGASPKGVMALLPSGVFPGGILGVGVGLGLGGDGGSSPRAIEVVIAWTVESWYSYRLYRALRGPLLSGLQVLKVKKGEAFLSWYAKVLEFQVSPNWGLSLLD